MVNTYFTPTTTAVGINQGSRFLGKYFWLLSIENCVFQAGIFHGKKKKKKKQAICCCLCVSEVGASHRIRGATAAVQQSLSFSVGATMFHKSDSFATTPATSRAPCEPATEPLTTSAAALQQWLLVAGILLYVCRILCDQR